jgi:class 3 adenylate cyclase
LAVPVPPLRVRVLRAVIQLGCWPIWVKLWITLLFAALVPMGLTSAYNLRGAMQSVEAMEYRNLELLAVATGNRVDQLIVDTQGTVAEIATDFEVEGLLAAVGEERERTRGSAQRTLENVVGSNPDIFSVLLLDRAGRCVASTNPDNVGADLSYRDYYLEAIKGEAHVSELLTGSTSSRPGVYFSRAVHAQTGEIVGVAVLKLKGETIAAMINSLHSGPERHALLIDEYGVVFAASDPTQQYRSLGSLPADVLAKPTFDRRFSSVGVDRIESLGLTELARLAPRASAPGHVSYLGRTGTRRIASFAPLRSKRWALAVTEPDSEFSAPLRALARQSAISAAAVGGVITALALLLARGIVSPVNSLTRAAQALRQGRFDDARVDERRGDEIGLLQRAFNMMARALTERDREREVFGRVVSPEVREKLLGGELGLGGETRYVSVLLSDMRGFSTMSESMRSQNVVAMLNEYLTEMTRSVRPWNGYVNNFIGDAIVVVFGAPVGPEDVERRAAYAALAMRDALARLNERRVARGDTRLETGIGISAGEVVAGQIGSPERMLYTVIGDAVNVAARLEALTKDKPGHPILVTRAVAQALENEAGVDVQPLGAEKVKGRNEPVEIYGLHRVEKAE